MKVFAYLYRTTSERFALCQEHDKPDSLRVFSVPEVAQKCSLDEDVVLDSIEKLHLLRLIDSDRVHDGVTEFVFSTNRSQFVLALFHILELLSADSPVYALRRDSSMNSDYLFESLWK